MELTKQLELLKQLCEIDGVSGGEEKVADWLKNHLPEDCKVRTDALGNLICEKKGKQTPKNKQLFSAHMDEVGFIITYIEESGLLRFSSMGGIDTRVVVGKPVRLESGALGVVGAKPIHLQSASDRETVLSYDQLYIDIGAKDAADARKYVQEGDPVHMNTYHQEMLNGFLSARGIDDRGCAYIILEALKQAKAMGCSVGVNAATTVGEETTGRGSHWVGTAIRPDVAIDTDVTFASDYPGVDAKQSGEVKLGCGGVLCNSSIGSRMVNDLMKAVAKEHNIPFQIESYMGRTYTDADNLHVTGTGVVTALLSLPLRYMHCPCEVCHMDDIENCIELLAQFLCRIDEHIDLDPFH